MRGQKMKKDEIKYEHDGNKTVKNRFFFQSYSCHLILSAASSK